MTAKENNSPIFIVGSSRSGTSLLAAMLSAHSRIACGPETQILHKTSKTRLTRILEDTEWPKRATNHLSKIQLADQPIIDIYDLTKQQLRQDLATRPQSITSLFEALAGSFARRHGKPRWAEKTPRHLLHLDAIRKEFPDAKIIRIVRDPRDSALSMRKLNWSSNDYLPNLYIWNDWYDKTDSFFATDTNSTTIRYEDLVHSPEDALTSLCQFIDEDFEENMLHTSESGKLVATKNETWKQQVSEKLDTSRCYRWKIELSEIENAGSKHLMSKWLIKFNYETSIQQSQPQPLPALKLDTDLIEKNQSLLLSIASLGYPIKSTETPRLEPNLLIFLTPEQASTSLQIKEINQLLLYRTLRRKKTIVLLHPDTKLKQKERIILRLISSQVYTDELIAPEKLLKKLGLRALSHSPN